MLTPAFVVVTLAYHGRLLPWASRGATRAAFSPRMQQSDSSDILAKLAQLEKIGADSEAGGKQQNRVEQRVSVFGARLDEDVAGEVDLGRGQFAQDQHQKDFDLGNKLMLRGEYKAAVSAFTQATVNAPGGLGGRKVRANPSDRAHEHRRQSAP